jgi:hypothetical protein
MSGGAGPAIDAVRMLYPEPWTVSAGRSTPSSGGDERRGYLLVPNATEPRLIMPAGPRRVLAATVRRQVPGSRPSARMKRLTLGGLAACGAAAGWPSRLDVRCAAGGDSIERWLEQVLDVAECRLAIRLGRPRANRKPVIQAMDARGAVHAFVKVGHNALSASLVAAEAAALEHLAGVRLRQVRVPRLLASDTWNGLRLLALEPLPVTGAEVPGELIRAAAQEISESASTRRLRWTGSGFRQRLMAGIASAGRRLVSLQHTVARLDAADPLVDFCAWHGDFNPGNFAVGHNGLLVWDWERYDRDVPMGFDLLHWTVQREITVLGVEPEEAARTLLDRAGAVLNRDVEMGSMLAQMYLAWLACRYVRDGQDKAGARLGEVEQWLLPALADTR